MWACLLKHFFLTWRAKKWQRSREVKRHVFEINNLMGDTENVGSNRLGKSYC